jgi:hypothetical protein
MLRSGSALPFGRLREPLLSSVLPVGSEQVGHRTFFEGSTLTAGGRQLRQYLQYQAQQNAQQYHVGGNEGNEAVCCSAVVKTDCGRQVRVRADTAEAEMVGLLLATRAASVRRTAERVFAEPMSLRVALSAFEMEVLPTGRDLALKDLFIRDPDGGTCRAPSTLTAWANLGSIQAVGESLW